MKLLVVIVCVFSIANAAPRKHIDDNNISEEDIDYIDLSQYGANIFMEPSNHTGDLVASYDPNTNDLNPEELGEYLEGDMLMPTSMGRNGLIATTSHWPGGIVPYEISGDFGMIRCYASFMYTQFLSGLFFSSEFEIKSKTFINILIDAYAMDMIERAINEYHRRTCIRFKQRTFERDYITFTSDNTGCWSSVGRTGGRQVLIRI